MPPPGGVAPDDWDAFRWGAAATAHQTAQPKSGISARSKRSERAKDQWLFLKP
jgi:hypothetical protein